MTVLLSFKAPSYPASSFPLTSGLVKPVCAVRDEGSRYEIAFKEKTDDARACAQ